MFRYRTLRSPIESRRPRPADTVQEMAETGHRRDLVSLRPRRTAPGSTAGPNPASTVSTTATRQPLQTGRRRSSVGRRYKESQGVGAITRLSEIGSRIESWPSAHDARTRRSGPGRRKALMYDPSSFEPLKPQNHAAGSDPQAQTGAWTPTSSLRRSSRRRRRRPPATQAPSLTPPAPIAAQGGGRGPSRQRNVGPGFVMGAVLASALLASAGTYAAVNTGNHSATIAPASTQTTVTTTSAGTQASGLGLAPSRSSRPSAPPSSRSSPTASLSPTRPPARPATGPRPAPASSSTRTASSSPTTTSSTATPRSSPSTSRTAAPSTPRSTASTRSPTSPSSRSTRPACRPPRSATRRPSRSASRRSPSAARSASSPTR